MKDLIKLMGILLSVLLFACSSDSGDDGGDGGGGGKDDVWDKSRTAKVLVISDLSAGNLFPNANYSSVVNKIRQQSKMQSC